MRAVLLVIFCAFLSLSASAQFWKKKKAPIVDTVRIPAELPFTADADTALSLWKDAINPEVAMSVYQPTVTQIEDAENGVMKDAKHHMRYREYALASISFSDLAALYLLQNRFSEAKWYLLQSNEITREQKDIKHTIANLIMLAQLKAAIGELPMAKADLQEAHDLANANTLPADATTIEKAILALETRKGLPKAELRYAEAVELKKKTK